VKVLPTLYIRGFPDELSKALKIRAVKEGKSLRELCIEILEASVDEKEDEDG
jgi:plasmid stability protein